MSVSRPDNERREAACADPGSTDLTAEEFLRYSRHLQLPGFSAETQGKLRKARVLVIGAGGLGAPVLQYLAAAGVGQLTILDGDDIELSNLQRQVLFTTDQVGAGKAQAAAASVSALNPEVKVDFRPFYLDADNAGELITDSDLLIDCTDNLATRYLINDACVQLGKPWIFASIYRFAGQLALFEGGGRPCFRCLFPDAAGAPDCNDAGVLGVLPGLLGMLQANEAIKYLTGLGDTVAGQLLTVDALRMSWKTFRLGADPDCPACGSRPVPGVEASLQDTGGRQTSAPGGPVTGIHADAPAPAGPEDLFVEEIVNEISPAQLKTLLAENPGLVLIDLRDAGLHRAFNLGGENISADDLASRINDLDPDAETLLYCQFGKRSLGAAHFLLQSGFTRVGSLTGGVENYLKFRIDGGSD